MAGDAVERWPVTRPVAKVAENFGVLPFERPWVPGLRAGGTCSPKRQERPTLRHGMTNWTGTGKHPTAFVYMTIVVAPKTSGPVSMTYIVGIGCPVDLHGWENIPVIDGEDGVDRLVELGFLFLKDLGIVLVVI